LLLTQQLQISSYSSKQKPDTQGMRSQAGSFICVMGNERADLAAVSALSLPSCCKGLDKKHPDTLANVMNVCQQISLTKLLIPSLLINFCIVVKLVIAAI